jgi:BlaI family penicillinase repressor
MSKAPQISDAEWEVMKAVWDHGPLTAGEVVSRLEAQTRWRPRTIKTLLSRLVAKGAVRAEPLEGAARTFQYRAAVAREVCARHESRSFLSRVFDGDVAPALLHLIKSADLSPADIEQLKRLLDEGARGGAKESRKEKKP